MNMIKKAAVTFPISTTSNLNFPVNYASLPLFCRINCPFYIIDNAIILPEKQYYGKSY